MSNARQLAANLPREGGLSNRNLIINGDLQVWQRATSTTSATLTYLIMDRFWTYNVNGTAQRSTDVPSGEGFVYSLHFDGSSTNPVTAFGQPIELPATGKTMLKANTDYTISFWVKGDVAGDITIYHRYRDVKASGTGNVNIDGGSSTVNVTTSWNRVTATFNTGTTVPSANNKILDLEFADFAEFTDLYFTGFQLEVGDTATPFEHRTYADQLQACKRYYWRPKDDGHQEQWMAQGLDNAGGLQVAVQHPVTMRATASVTIPSPNNLYWEASPWTAVGATVTSLSVNIGHMGPDGGDMGLFQNNSVTRGHNYNIGNAYFAFDAEL
nr:hypothetical protein 5 [bacterium]